MNNLLKKIEKLPTIAIFFALWFLVDKIIEPVFLVLIYKAGWQVFMPSFDGTIITAAIVTLAVMQILKKCNIVVPIAAGVVALGEIFNYFGSVGSFFNNIFNGWATTSSIIVELLYGLSNLIIILAFATVTVLGLYGSGIIKKLGKLNLLTYAPAAFAALALIVIVFSGIIGLLFSIGHGGFVKELIFLLIVSLPSALWYALITASVGLWAGSQGKEKENALSADEVINVE